MSFAQLRETILTAGKKQSAALRERYAQTIFAEEERIQSQARALEESIIAAAQARGTQRAQRLHQEAQLAAKAAVLKAKQEELTALKEETVQRILSWDREQSRRLLGALFKLLDAETAHGRSVVIAGAAHADDVAGLAAKRGLKVAKETIPDDGGFVYRDATTELRATVRFLVEQVFAKNRSQLAKTLFD